MATRTRRARGVAFISEMNSFSPLFLVAEAAPKVSTGKSGWTGTG